MNFTIVPNPDHTTARLILGFLTIRCIHPEDGRLARVRKCKRLISVVVDWGKEGKQSDWEKRLTLSCGAGEIILLENRRRGDCDLKKNGWKGWKRFPRIIVR